jgi:predicted GIY-YIG superfamily endonuclease
MAKGSVTDKEAYSALYEVGGNVMDAIMLVRERRKTSLSASWGRPSKPIIAEGYVDTSEELLSPACIYVLNCTDDHFYVGQTCNLEERYRQHVRKEACEWTRLHPVVSLLDTIEYQPGEMDKEHVLLQEDVLTRVFMFKHGIDKVRGGSYSAAQLPEHQIKSLLHEQRHMRGECFNCGSKEHFASDCPEPRRTKGSVLQSARSSVDDIVSRVKELENWRSALVPRLNEMKRTFEENRTEMDDWSEEVVNSISTFNEECERNITLVMRSTADVNDRIVDIEAWRGALVPRLTEVNTAMNDRVSELELLSEEYERNVTSLYWSLDVLRDEVEEWKSDLVGRLKTEMEAKDEEMKALRDEITANKLSTLDMSCRTHEDFLDLRKVLTLIDPPCSFVDFALVSGRVRSATIFGLSIFPIKRLEAN